MADLTLRFATEELSEDFLIDFLIYVGIHKATDLLTEHLPAPVAWHSWFSNIFKPVEVALQKLILRRTMNTTT